MTEETTTPTGGTTEATPPGEPTELAQNEPTEPKVVDHEADAAKWRAMARKHEKQAKENADAAKKLQEIEDANKSESQKLQDKAAEADKRAAEAEARALRLEVASEKGLTPAQAKRLVGTTKEELEADADELVASFKSDDGTKDDKSKGRPKETLRSGATSSTEPEITDYAAHVAKLPRY